MRSSFSDVRLNSVAAYVLIERFNQQCLRGLITCGFRSCEKMRVDPELLLNMGKFAGWEGWLAPPQL